MKKMKMMFSVEAVIHNETRAISSRTYTFFRAYCTKTPTFLGAARMVAALHPFPKPRNVSVLRIESNLALGLSYDAQKALVEIVGSASFQRNNSVDGREIKRGSVKILREESTGYDPMLDRGRGNSGSYAVYSWVDWVPAREITPADIQQAERQAAGVEVVNLTPHPLQIERTDGTVASIPATGQVARLAVAREARNAVKTMVGEFAVFAPQLGEIEGLPDPQAGKIYVVSALVADAAKRQDVFSPGELLRDTDGKIVGARGLCAYGN